MRTLSLAVVVLALALHGAAQIRIVAAPGAVDRSTFVNRSLGIEYSFPEGWTARVPAFPKDDTKLGFALLAATPDDARDRRRIALYAVPLSWLPEELRDPQKFLTAHLLPTKGQAEGPPRARAQLGPAVPLDVFSRPFVRMDWQVTLEGGVAPPDPYETEIAGSVNGQMLLLIARAPTAAAADDLADSADSFRFFPPEGEQRRAPINLQARPEVVRRVAVTESELRARLRTKVEPSYPAEARNRGVEGQVLLAVVVGADGSVLEASVESGHPLLNDAALDAVRQWKFEPMLVDGAPAESEARIRVTFTLVAAKQSS
jgi:TonB family protein